MNCTFSPTDVHIVRTPLAAYGPCDGPAPPELPRSAPLTSALVGLRRLWVSAGLDLDRYDTPDWNPLGQCIRPGARVLIKPNWVFHENQSGRGLDCLVTHASVLEALLHYVMKARPGRVVLGDAPIQGCDFEALKAAHGLDALCRRFQGHGDCPDFHVNGNGTVPFDAGGAAVSLADFRATVLPGGQFWSKRLARDGDSDSFVLFDLGAQSALEPITGPDTPFRVSMYDPQSLRRTHSPGRHQYLIAREALQADLVINVPKLKTHRKTGLTGALKNLVGTNAHKEYLPHHRKGGTGARGDCYAGRSRLRQSAEELLDWANGSRRAAARFLYSQAAAAAIRLGRWLGSGGDVEGSWHGNDTIWRTCLDLQRILHYGRPDGSMADRPQRQILNLADAVIAGEAEGPLAPEPVALGVLTLGSSAPAVDWVHALLMRLEPRAIPLVREAFSAREYPLVDFGPQDICVWLDGGPTMLTELPEVCGRDFRLPSGWKGRCELPRRPSGGCVPC